MSGHLFIVGAQRSGSTYLYEILDEHPAVRMARPVRPEPKVFLREAGRPESVVEWETELFGGPDPEPAAAWLGEKSTTYIERPEVAERIRRAVPSARILIILRDPVQRAWSNYRFSVANGLEHLSFDDALRAEDERLRRDWGTSTNPFAYRTRGQYAQQVAAYTSAFDEHDIRVLVFEDFTGDRAAVSELYRWLDIDPSIVPQRLASIINESPKERPDPATMHWLAERFDPAVAELEQLLGRSMQVWRTRWDRM